MASAADTLTTSQLQQARTQLWHQDGSALRTQDDAREWLDAAGLVPYYPHTQFAVPQGSFAEAILGRPAKGWIPPSAEDSSGEESYAAVMEDEDSADEVADADELDDFGEEDQEDEEDQEESGPEASDDEVMLSDDDEFTEDEGNEIAEEDRIHAQGDPVPNDLRETPLVEEKPTPVPVNGFSHEERETVRHQLARMVAEGSAVPLNLLGSAGSEPDFICSAQAFSFVYTLRGDKGWKQEPAQTGSMRVSPLAGKVFASLREKGAMTPQELAAEIGQGVVDSAVVRALSELWAILRVVPLGGSDGAPEKWELLTAHHMRQIKAGANAGQPTALSALLSLYLTQVMAASSDDIESYLSPLAARSRIREVVSALAASRQVEQTAVDGKTLVYIPGALDNLPQDRPEQQTVPATAQRSRYEDDDRRAMIAERRAREADAGTQERPQRRESSAREQRPGGFGKPSFGGRPQSGFSPQRRSGGFSAPRRDGGFAPRPDDRERRPFQRRDDAPGPSRPRNEFARPWDENRGSREGQEARRPFTPREGERRPSAYNRPSGDRKPFGDRPFTPRNREDRPLTPRGGDRPFTPRREGERPYAGNGDERRPSAYNRPAGGSAREERRPFTPREGSERRPFTPRGDRPFQPRGDRPFQPRGDRPVQPRDHQGDRGDRPFRPREEGERRPFTPRRDRPFAPRGDRPFAPRGDRPFAPRGDRPFTPREDRSPSARGDRPFAPREGRPFTPREGGDRRPSGGDRQGFSGDRPDRNRFSGEPGEGRPAFKSGGKSAGPGGAKFGGAGFGRDRKGAPGGFGKPGFSPARRGPGTGPGRGGAPKRRPE